MYKVLVLPYCCMKGSSWRCNLGKMLSQFNMGGVFSLLEPWMTGIVPILWKQSSKCLEKSSMTLPILSLSIMALHLISLEFGMWSLVPEEMQGFTEFNNWGFYLRRIASLPYVLKWEYCNVLQMFVFYQCLLTGCN